MRKSLLAIGVGLLALISRGALGVEAPAARFGERWRWRVFDRDEGVSPGAITAIYQNADDYIYAASELGLCRYDLHHWEIVENSEALDDGPILRIVEGSNTIYCASRHAVWLARGGTRLDRLHPSDGNSSDRVFIAATRLGEVFLIDGARHFRVRERIEAVDDGAPIPVGVLDYEIDASGVHWLATESGLRYRDLAGQQPRWLEYRAPDLPFPGADCLRLLRVDSPPRVPLPRPQRVSAREVWGAFRVRGDAAGWRLARLEGREWQALDAPPFDSPPDGVVRDTRGNYAITCENGRLFVLESGPLDAGIAERWSRVAELGLGPVKLHGGVLDSRGSIWFRLGAGGVALVDLVGERWERLVMPGVAGPPFPRVTSLLETRDGGLWAGTTDFLLHYRAGESGEATGEPAVYRSILGVPLSDVTALGEQVRERQLPSRIWVGSETFQGLFFYELDPGAESPGEGGPGGAWFRVQLDEPIHRICRDPRGDLWFLPGADRHGKSPAKLYRLSPDTLDERRPSPVRIESGVPEFQPEFLSVNDFIRVPGSRDDSFWLATEDGLLRCRLESADALVVDRRFTETEGLVSSRIWAVEEGPDGSIWMCYPSSGRGVTRLREGERPETFDVRQGLAGPDVWSIVRAGPSLWFGTDAGLSREDDGIWYSLSVASEEPRSSFVIPIVVSRAGVRDDTLIIGTAERGIYRFRLDDERRPRFRKISFPERLREGDPITFRWRARDFKNETPPERLIYRWRLDGGPWTQRVAVDSVTFDEPLAPGRHTFELEVRDLDGNRNRDYSERLHEFVVAPRSPWWPPIAVSALGAGALSIALFFWQSRRRRRRGKLGRYRRIWLAAPFPALVIARDERVEDYNGREPESLGLREGQEREIIGRPVNLVPAIAVAGIERELRELLFGRAFVKRGAEVSLNSAGAVRVLEIWGFPLRSVREKAGVDGGVLFLRDVTRDQECERLASREERLRAIRDFAEQLSARVFGSLVETDLQESDDPNRGARNNFEVRSAIEAAARSVRGLEAFLRPEMGSREAALIDLEPVIGTIVGARENGASGALPGGIVIDWRPQTGLWRVRGDSESLGDIFAALVENAVEAMTAGGTLSIRAVNVQLESDPGGLAGGAYVEVTVRDTGPGIERERADLVFDPFYSTKPRTGARGLGLSLAWGVARALGGDIRVDRASGRGASIRVWLPAE